MTSFTQEDVVRVAEGLTWAQRAALLKVDRWTGVSSNERYHCMKLVGLGLLGTRKERGGRYFWPLQFSIAVRNHLKETTK